MLSRTITRNDFILISIMLIWAVNLSIVKIALKEIPYLPFNALRLIVAALFLVIFAIIRHEQIFPERSDLLNFVWLAILGIAVYQYLFLKGLDLTTASNSGLIFGSSPIFIALLSNFYKHERLSAVNWLGVLTAFGGLYLVVVSRNGFRFASDCLYGNLYLLAAVILWAHYSVQARPILEKYSPLGFTTFTFTLGSLLFFSVSLSAVVNFRWQSVSAGGWLALIFSGIVALSLALLLWFRSVREVGNTRTAVYSNLQPVFAVFFGSLLLKEELPILILLGMVIILVGIFLTKLKRKEK